MNWKAKSAVQRACAALPFGKEAAYYSIQRLLGRLSGTWDSSFLLSEAARLAKKLGAAGHPVNGAVVMEVGTGRNLDMPVGFYLCGAKEVHTWDLHRLLKEHVVADLLAYIRNHRERLGEVFAGIAPPDVLNHRLETLCAIQKPDDIWSATGLRYHAPADAAKTDLPKASVDIQTSYTVFEHIPAEVLTAILREAGRILKPTGAAMHHIDLSDHFAHADSSISSINFLRFTPSEWHRYSDNSFAYHNRLRAPAYRDIYGKAGHRVVSFEEFTDERSLKELRNGFPLAGEFREIPPEVLAIGLVQVLSRPGA